MEEEKDMKVQYYTDVRDRLEYALRCEYRTDFIIHVGEEGQPSSGVFKTHQSVLAASSGVFRNLLSSRVLASQKHLHLSCTHTRFFSEVLRYMYTNEMTFDTPNDFGNIRQHAIAYDFPKLIQACDDYVNIAVFNPENVIAWLDVSFKHQLLKLRERCEEFITNNTDKVFQCERFMETNECTFNYILKYVKIRMSSELVLLKTIMKWIEVNEEYYIRNDYDIPSVTKFFVKYVKFIYINARDFEKVFTKYQKFFGRSIVFDIFKVITNPRNRLPTWMRSMSPRMYAENLEQISVRSGQNFSVQYNTFAMPIDESRVKKHLSLLQTVLRIKCDWMPTILLGATLICPGIEGKGKVKLHWECHTFGCYEEIDNSMSFEKYVQVKKNQISIRFPKQFVLESSVVFNLAIKIEYDGEKHVDLPVTCSPLVETCIFSTYGRNPYFDGDIIVSEILYL